MEQHTFGGVVLTRPGISALLAEDGLTVTLISRDGDDPSGHAVDPAVMDSLMDELHRAGLPDGLAVVDEWTEEEDGQLLWVTVLG